MGEADARAEGLLAANSAFYGAFERRDLAAMREVWLAAEHAICIHPGWPVCRGPEEIEESWQRIFDATPYIEFTIAVLDSGIRGDRGWVICEEGVLQSMPTGMSRFLVVATNMFAEIDGQWRMVLHHGSPVHEALGAYEDLEA